MAANVIAATTEQATTEPDGEIETSPGADSAPAAADASENGKPQDGVSTRIDELTRNWRETERDRDHWRELALKNQREVAPREIEERETEPTGEPELKTLADFNYDEVAYAKHMRDVARETAKRETESIRKELRESRTKEEREHARTEFQDRAQSWAKEQKIADFDLVFRDPRDGGPIVTETMAETILDSEQGAAVLYHLAKNKTFSASIARLPP